MSKTSLTVEAIFLIFSRALHSILLFLPVMILSRILPYEEYGSYKQIFLIISLLIPLFSLGLPQSINFFIPQLDKKKQKTFVFQTYASLLVIGLLVSLILFFGANSISLFFGNPSLENILRIFSLYPLFYLPVHMYSNLLSSMKKIKLLCIMTISFGILQLAAILIPILVGLHLTEIFVFLLVNSIMQFVILLVVIMFLYRCEEIRVDEKLFHDQWIFSAPLAFSSILGILNLKIGQLIVSHFFSTGDYAVYSNGAFELPFVDIFLGSVMAIIIPYLVMKYKSGKRDEYLKLWHNAVLKMSLLTIPLTTFIIFFSQEVILILYGDKYLLSVPLFSIFSIILYSRFTLYGDVLRTLNKTKLIFLSAFFSLLLNVVLNLVFIMYTPLGLIGPALTAVLSQYTINLMQLYFIGATLKVRFYRVLPWINLLKLFSVSVCILPVMAMIKLLNLNTLPSIFSGAAIYFTIFYFAVFLLNVSESRKVIIRIYLDLNKLVSGRK